MPTHSISGLLTARFILRIRAYNQNKNPLGGGSHTTGTSNNFSSFNAASRNVVGGVRSSLADEFGEDPYDMVFRVSQSQTTTMGLSLESDQGEGPKHDDGGGVVAELLEQMRRGMERVDYGDGISSMEESRFDEEKHQTMAMDGDIIAPEVDEHGRDGSRMSAEVQP